MRILVTGGAGYVGSHCLRRLLDAGHTAVVYDNLSRGHYKAVPEGLLVEGDLSDEAKLTGYVQEIPSAIHVSKPFSDALRKNSHAYRVHLRYGSLFEPSVTGVEFLPQ